MPRAFIWRFTDIEISPAYCKLAAERIAAV